VLASQYEPCIEVYRKENDWQQEVFTSGQTAHLDQLDLELAVLMNLFRYDSRASAQARSIARSTAPGKRVSKSRIPTQSGWMKMRVMRG